MLRKFQNLNSQDKNKIPEVDDDDEVPYIVYEPNSDLAKNMKAGQYRSKIESQLDKELQEQKLKELEEKKKVEDEFRRKKEKIESAYEFRYRHLQRLVLESNEE